LAFGIPIVHMILELFLAARRREEKHAIKASLHGDLDEPAATEEAEDAATAPPIKSSNQVITSGLGAGPLALIMAPTRELAMQVCQSLRDIAQFSPVKVAPIVGGISIEKQERFLRRQPHIIVATPGRLWEHYERVRCPHIGLGGFIDGLADALAWIRRATNGCEPCRTFGSWCWTRPIAWLPTATFVS